MVEELPAEDEEAIELEEATEPEEGIETEEDTGTAGVAEHHTNQDQANDIDDIDTQCVQGDKALMVEAVDSQLPPLG